MRLLAYRSISFRSDHLHSIVTTGDQRLVVAISRVPEATMPHPNAPSSATLGWGYIGSEAPALFNRFSLRYFLLCEARLSKCFGM